jgi:hypothetical protein
MASGCPKFVRAKSILAILCFGDLSCHASNQTFGATVEFHDV